MQSTYEFLIPVAMFFVVAIIVKIVSDNRIRHKLIDKDMVDENLKYFYLKRFAIHPLSNIKWGFILVGISIPLLLDQFFPDYFTGEGIMGLMFLFAGIGFIIYYFIAKREMEKNEVEE